MYIQWCNLRILEVTAWNWHHHLRATNSKEILLFAFQIFKFLICFSELIWNFYSIFAYQKHPAKLSYTKVYVVSLLSSINYQVTQHCKWQGEVIPLPFLTVAFKYPSTLSHTAVFKEWESVLYIWYCNTPLRCLQG